MLRSLGWAITGFGAAHVLESAWHRFTAHGKRPDPTRTGHLEHHRKANEEVDVGGEIREHAGRLGKQLLVANLVLAPLVGLRRTVPLTLGLAAGLVAVSYYHARMHRRAPRGRYEEWMWRFHWHHHASNVRVNFGLTNPLLDFALGTAVVPAEVEIPAKLAPAWLHAAGGSVAGLSIRAIDRARTAP
ncbi:MAG: sterol desaturase family protein [Deltaproteobacteria bacterium]|nr:sterol desaturase family protein [Deltaproteobacteria bacterium]